MPKYIDKFRFDMRIRFCYSSLTAALLTSTVYCATDIFKPFYKNGTISQRRNVCSWLRYKTTLLSVIKFKNSFEVERQKAKKKNHNRFFFKIW
ncbi:hypothetical protein GCM10007968_04380 [Sporolactobacillus putidus]|uniref:Uncharacterized protein n=1 Tax=Sporolactobacillus putidus TaxID=492735 RepID=A0A917RYY0_9BACL|nr:hypothetical protein GCM10007968_04380 [Sporolactobacillus putidus]